LSNAGHKNWGRSKVTLKRVDRQVRCISRSVHYTLYATCDMSLRTHAVWKSFQAQQTFKHSNSASMCEMFMEYRRARRLKVIVYIRLRQARDLLRRCGSAIRRRKATSPALSLKVRLE